MITQCVLLFLHNPPALSLSGLVNAHTSFGAHWPSGTSASQASLSHTHTHAHGTSCVCVCICIAWLLFWGNFFLSKCHHGVSVNQCCASHPHSRFAVLCVGNRLLDECDARVCVMHTHRNKPHQGFPGLPPLQHICQRRLSVHLWITFYCLSLSPSLSLLGCWLPAEECVTHSDMLLL